MMWHINLKVSIVEPSLNVEASFFVSFYSVLFKKFSTSPAMALLLS
jgi:hypothetical protein